MKTAVLDFDLVVFGLDLLINTAEALWPSGKRIRPVLFLWPGFWALTAAVIFRDHPWAAGVFTADAVLSAVLAWRNRK